MNDNKILKKDINNNYIYTEEERLEQINNINDSIIIYNIAMTLSDNNKVDDRILKKLEKYDLVLLLKSIDDVELVKKGLKYLDGYGVVTVINQDKYDQKTKLSLMEYINDLDINTKEYYMLDIVNTIFEDDLLEEALKYFTIDANKTEIIKRINNDNIKLKLAQNLLEEYNRYEVLRTMDTSNQLKNLEILNLSSFNKEQIILSKNESGSYVYTEEERLEQISSIDDSKIYNIAITLSDNNKVDDRILKTIGKYDLVLLLKSIDDIELVKKGLKYLDGYGVVKVINQDKYDQKTKLSLLEYVNDEDIASKEHYILSVVNNILEDDLLEEALKYFTIDTNKTKIIKRINNDNIKLKLAQNTLEENNRYEVLRTMNISNQLKSLDILNLSSSNKEQIILSQNESGSYIYTEEERLEQISNIDNSNIIYNIAMTLSGNNKVDDRILKTIGKYDLVLLLKSIDDIELVKKGLKYLDGDNVVKIINQDKYDQKTKLSLIDYINDTSIASKEHYMLSVVNNILEDNLLEEALKYFTIDSNKIKIIKRINNDNIKLKLAQNLLEEKNRYEVLRTMDISDQLKNLENLNLSSFNKEQIILSKNKSGLYVYTEEERLEQISNIDNSRIYNIAMTLSDNNKVDDRILKKLGKYDLVLLLKSIDDIELVKKGLRYLDGYNVANVINQDKYDQKTKLSLMEYINDTDINMKEHYMLSVVNNILEDDLLEEALKYFISDEKKIEIIKRINNDDIKLKLAKKLIENIKNINSIKNVIYKFSSDIKNQLLITLDNIVDGEKNILSITDKQMFNKEFVELGFGSKYRVLTSNNKNISDDVRILFLKDFLSEQDRLDVISKIILDENKVIAYNQKPFHDEKNKMSYIRLFHDDNKKEQLDILDNDIDKLIIINEIKDSTLQAKALVKLDNYKELFYEVFNQGNYQLISKFDDKVLTPLFNNKQIKILRTYNNCLTAEAKMHFSKYVNEHYDILEEKDIEVISKLIFNITTSNSEEIYKQSDSFITNILNADDPISSFCKVENVFLKSHLPYFAKSYITFLTVHPNFSSYKFHDTNLSGANVSSVVLNDISLLHRKVLVLSDLIKCSLGSNSRNFLQYISKLEKGNNIYLNNKTSNYDTLSDDEKNILKEFRDNILTLYDSYLRKARIKPSLDVLDDLNKINDFLCKGKNDGSLLDLVIDGYCHFIGITTLDEVKKYIYDEVINANARNIKRYKDNDYRIEQGDFIKGFNINYFFDMVNSGVVAHDYLGADMQTDMTALDTDLSRIWKDTKKMSIKDIIDLKDQDSGKYGQAYIVIKDNPNNINITKKSNNEEYSRVNNIEKKDIFDNKLEAFSNGQGTHISNPYGIRTGFSIANIDFIVFDEEGGIYKENIYKLILPLAMSGIYIPIISKQTEQVLFSIDDYNKLREKMNGLKQYQIDDYKLSNNIDSTEFREIVLEIDEANKYTREVKEKILKIFNDGLDNEFNLITHINGKLEKDEIQVLDTGSTSRFTNIPYDGDYDFIIRIDRNIDNNIKLKEEFIKKIISKFNIVKPGIKVNGDIKEMVVKIDDKEFKLDLSFVRKTDKVSYSTEMCVSDRLDTIKGLYPDKYRLVLANIIYAKKYLKENNCYLKGAYKQGGIGGVGVENWILQNGGSFYDAAVEFISYATYNGSFISYNDFINSYRVWDFGENFYTDRENRKYNRYDNLHDNFIAKNLTEEGYKNMCDALKRFIANYEFSKESLFNDDKEKQNKI